MTERISALKNVIDTTLSVITDGREQVQLIAEGTQAEVQRLEREFEDLQQACSEAIGQVERLERESRSARERLMIVNRDIQRTSETDMQKAYEYAQNIQVELGQWREREVQLRYRRDDIARRLKAVRATAHQAEVLMLKFKHTTSYLTQEFEEMASALETAHIQSTIGLQMLQMQEDERSGLAARLHDGPMQSLASVAMRLQVPVPAEQSSDIRLRLNHIISDLRQMVFDLRPPLLDDLGLVPTIKRYVQQWSNTFKLTVRIHLVGLETTLSRTEKITMFRCIQEALQNVVRHTQSAEVDITLMYGTGDLRVQVADNGAGIGEVDWMQWLDSGRIGLGLCRQRMSILGGTVDIEANEPHGTKVIFTLPMQRGLDA